VVDDVLVTVAVAAGVVAVTAATGTALGTALEDGFRLIQEIVLQGWKKRWKWMDDVGGSLQGERRSATEYRIK